MLPTEIWVALIGLTGTLATVFGTLWKRERTEARKDRETAEEMRSQLRVEISLQDSVPCVSSSCPRRSAATPSTALTVVLGGDPRSGNPNSA